MELTEVRYVKTMSKKKFIFYVKFCQFFVNFYGILVVFLDVKSADQVVFGIFKQSNFY